MPEIAITHCLQQLTSARGGDDHRIDADMLPAPVDMHTHDMLLLDKHNLLSLAGAGTPLKSMLKKLLRHSIVQIRPQHH